MLIIKYNITALHTNTVYAKRAKIVGGHLILTRVDDTLLNIDLAVSEPVFIRPMVQETPYERNNRSRTAGEWEDPLADE